MSHSVRKHLRLDIDAYDATIRRFIPAYEEMVATAVHAVVEHAPGLVLDLGAGTGALAAAVLERSKDAVVELVDIDKEMLTRARMRLAAFDGRTRFALRSFDEPLPACDAVMASLALHHVPTLAAKTALFGRIHSVLEPGGLLVNADVTVPAEQPERTSAYEAWADHLVANGCRRADAFGHFEAWAQEDTYFPLEDELNALTEAGFDASCAWQHGVSTVVVARKA
jgi:ubiquinone/menaquinone biosynthesis C-methylase UbiE